MPNYIPKVIFARRVILLYTKTVTEVWYKFENKVEYKSRKLNFAREF